MNEAIAADINPKEFPQGITCCACHQPLDSSNAMMVDISDPTPQDQPRVWLYSCIHCIIQNKDLGDD